MLWYAAGVYMPVCVCVCVSVCNDLYMCVCVCVCLYGFALVCVCVCTVLMNIEPPTPVCTVLYALSLPRRQPAGGHREWPDAPGPQRPGQGLQPDHTQA